MKRRDFIKAAGVAGLMPSIALSENTAIDNSFFPNSIMDGSLQPSSGSLDVIAGTLPYDIYGHIFIAEGIPLEKNHFTPNSKGALTRVDFTNSGASFARNMINTPSAIMQNHVDSFLDKFYLLGGTIYFSPNLGFMNYCNTAPIYMGDNRFALNYEGGIPYEFDGSTLDLITPIGEVSDWKSSLPPIAEAFAPDKWLFPQIRTTAHPYFDFKTGECYTMNYGGNMGTTGTRHGFVRLIKWDRESRFNSWTIVNREGNNIYISTTSHSLGVTRNHIIIFETASRVENTRVLGTKIITPQEHKTPIWVIRKSDLYESNSKVVADTIILDFDTSDIMCNYDDYDDELTFYGHYLGAMDKSEPQFYYEKLFFGGRVLEDISGYPVAPVDVGGLVRARVKVNYDSIKEITSGYKVIRDEKLLWDMNVPAYKGQYQFPDEFKHIYWVAIGYRPEHVVTRVAKAYQNYPNRLYTNETLPTEMNPSALVHMDCQQMSITDEFSFPNDCVMQTAQFLPRRGSFDQDDGYIITPVVRKYPTNGLTNGKEYWLFDGKNLAQGPICILASQQLNFATTNHALWVDSIGPRPANAYKADIAGYFKEKLPSHSRQVQQAIKSHVLPRFS
ncbi:carotenoid oxygenase family protein [Endozoicomonas sp. SM1973]|uniref:Carotenoid oxygenase family protein n=1 Tax=Spartinivicinus marinus TaxID=2994442 RepID=A0A853I1Z3_9GAMM|nr:carotenoid oxygenase family protein [Spartinivicinus marinus]MCX4028935.1 carotenoid oxygenase family protein [Spartinivicinus marinus]NYZ65482.1 carotenoid oxygenase family protein [Spartinivicinus marinus]